MKFSYLKKIPNFFILCLSLANSGHFHESFHLLIPYFNKMNCNIIILIYNVYVEFLKSIRDNNSLRKFFSEICGNYRI